MPELNLFGEEFVARDPERWASMSGDFQTPIAVCRFMVSLLQALPDPVTAVLEPTKGKGNIVTALEESGYTVYAPENYWAMQKRRFDAVVMNPPFSSKYANMFGAPVHLNKSGMMVGYHILKECMEMSDEVVALMPWFTVSDSDVRVRALKAYGFRGVYSLPRKTFDYTRIQTVVLHLVRGWEGEITFKFL